MKIKKLFAAALALVALAACQEKEPELGPAGIKADKTAVEFSSEVSSASISVTATRDWNSTITYSSTQAEKWLSVTPASGKASNDAQTVEITALANDGYDRSATIKFTIGLADALVTVSQKGPKGEASPYDAEQITCAEFLERKDSQTDYILEGTISGVTNSSYIGFDLNDGTGTVPCAFPTNFDEFASQLKNGCKVKIMGKYNYYEKKGTHQMANGTIISVEAGEPLPEAKASTVKAFIDGKDENTEYVLTGTASECAFGSSYWGFVLTDETGSIQCPFPANWDEYKDQISDGSTVKIQGAYSYYSQKEAHQLKNGTILSVTAGTPAEQQTYEGIVVAVSKAAFLIKTTDGYKYAYDKNNVPTVSVGDKVKLSGELSMYGKLEEIINYTVEVISTGNAVTHPEIKNLTGSEMDTYETMFGYVGFTGKLSISGNYYNIIVDGSSKTGSLANANNVDASLNGKMVDCKGYFIGLTGSDKYFNIILTSIKASDDQSGSDPGDGGNTGGGSEGSSDLVKPAENEVLHVLTNEEICAVTKDGSVSGTAYGTYGIESKGGNWTGNFAKSSSNTFLQFRNNNASYLTSPEYSSKVVRVVLETAEEKYNASSATNRAIYAVPVVDPSSLPTGKLNGNNINYTEAQWETNYGSTTFKTTDGHQFGEIKFNTETKQFSLISANGAVYIEAIYVFCEK
ncbi:MAG: exodeoxyribonuclease VII large subunit [Candidatus Cryptobacteroides sp.]